MAEPLAVVLVGIKAKWDGETTLGAAPTSLPLHFEERQLGTQENPAEGTHLPYAVFWRPRSDTEAYSCGSIFTNCLVTIRIYAATPEACRTHANAAKAIFDSDALSLTLSEGSIVRHRPIGSTYVLADKNVYFVELDYEFLHRKPRVS